MRHLSVVDAVGPLCRRKRRFNYIDARVYIEKTFGDAPEYRVISIAEGKLVRCFQTYGNARRISRDWKLFAVAQHWMGCSSLCRRLRSDCRKKKKIGDPLLLIRIVVVETTFCHLANRYRQWCVVSKSQNCRTSVAWVKATLNLGSCPWLLGI